MNNRGCKKFNKVLYRDDGISLIEVLVSIAILGIIAAPLASMFISSIRTDYEAEMRLEALTVAQRCMEVQKNYNTLPDNVSEEEIYNDGKFRAYRTISKNSTSVIPRDAGVGSLDEDTLFVIELDSLGGMSVKDYNDTSTDASFLPTAENIRILTIGESGGYQYTDGALTTIKSNSSLEIHNVVIRLDSSLQHDLDLNIDNNKRDIVDIYIYDDNGHVNINSIDGDISVQEYLTTSAEDFDDLAVYDITIIVRNAATGVEVERIQSQRMMYK